jgi:hypothetical protein
MIRLTYLRHPSIALAFHILYMYWSSISEGIPKLWVTTYCGGGDPSDSKWSHRKASAYTGHNISDLEYTSVPTIEFEPTITVFEWSKLLLLISRKKCPPPPLRFITWIRDFKSESAAEGRNEPIHSLIKLPACRIDRREVVYYGVAGCSCTGLGHKWIPASHSKSTYATNELWKASMYAFQESLSQST